MKRVRTSLVVFVRFIKKKYSHFLARRPHRSFRLTRRRDYVRSFSLPGYWAFTAEVMGFLWSSRLLFLRFVTLYSILTFLALGMMSQTAYQTLSTAVKNINVNIYGNGVDAVGEGFAIFTGVIVGSFNAPQSQAQQLYSVLFIVLGWLTMVWLLRQRMAGKKVAVRDGVYSSGGPLLSTAIIVLLISLQLIPIFFAVIVYGTALEVNLFSSVLLTTLFWIVDSIFILLSLYWLSSSLIALVVVTLPGMHPWAAVRASGDLIIGRRLRIIYRFLWMILLVVAAWAVVIIPAVVISDVYIPVTVPVVPVLSLLLSVLTLVWVATYIYLLYRKLVDDGAAPA